MTLAPEELLLLHHWAVVAEHDAGYVLGQCRVCGLQELLDLVPALEHR
jgi:hypothetical protein